jgi:hypothetical protein
MSSNMLALLAYSGVIEEEDMGYYFSVSYTLVSSVCEPIPEAQTPADVASHMRKVLGSFGPFVLHCANAWFTCNGSIPPQMSNFSHGVKYFENFMASD